VLVEVAEANVGTEHIARSQVGVLQAETRLDEAIQAARPAIRSLLETLRELASEEHVVDRNQVERRGRSGSREDSS
jgi:hypothetical protein